MIHFLVTSCALAAIFLLATSGMRADTIHASSMATAQARLIAFSPQVDPTTAEGPFGLDYEIQFTTLENEMNGEFEFAPPRNPVRSHLHHGHGRSHPL